MTKPTVRRPLSAHYYRCKVCGFLAGKGNRWHERRECRALCLGAGR